eukprot:scaffold51_cov152-Skeletonema_marinoi.AAC.2
MVDGGSVDHNQISCSMTATDAPADASTHTEVPPSKSSSNNKSSNKNAKKGKKRKLNKQSREELYIAERKDRYNKLHHACSKLLHREAKVVKSFMCQKVGKDIKAAQEKESSIKDSEEAAAEVTAKLLAKTQKRRTKLEQKLEQTKKFELSAIVDVGLKRIGVTSLNSSMDTSDDENDTTDDKNASSKPSSSQADDPFYADLIESMLQHKRLSSAMDQLNDKVTDFRQWSTRRQQMLMEKDDPAYADEFAGGGKKRKKHMQMEKTNETLVFAGGKRNGRNMGGHEGTSGLFIGSLSGIPVEGYDEGGEDGEDNYGYDDVMNPPKKKNRPGQRQRKAKAMAIEAKKSGKTWDASDNWREKKKGNVRRDDSRSNDGRRDNEAGRDDRRHNDNADSAKPRKAEEIAEMGKSWKEEGNAHPSWAAAAAQKSQGIQAFKGKKITFD